MAHNDSRGVEIHALRSHGHLGAVAWCNYVITDGRYTTDWDSVTCGNCLACRPKWDRETDDDTQKNS